MPSASRSLPQQQRGLHPPSLRQNIPSRLRFSAREPASLTQQRSPGPEPPPTSNPSDRVPQSSSIRSPRPSPFSSAVQCDQVMKQTQSARNVKRVHRWALDRPPRRKKRAGGSIPPYPTQA